MVSMPRDEVLLAVAAFVAVAAATLALFLAWDALADVIRRHRVRRRLESGDRLGVTDARLDSVLKPRDQASSSRLDRVLAHLPRGADLALTLERARVGWTPGMFLLLTLGFGLAGAVLGWSLGGWLGGLVGLVAAGGFPRLWVSRRRKVRMHRFEEEFPEAVDLLARATRAGHPFSAGIAMVGREGPPVVAEEFGQVAEEHRLGMSLEDALWGLVDRVDVLDVRIFATAVLVQRDVGGNLAEILDKIGETIRARFTVRRQLRVYTAQGRLTGYVLAVFPVVVATGLYFLDRDYISVLWTNMLGRYLIGFALCMQVVGYLWIRHIVDIEI